MPLPQDEMRTWMKRNSDKHLWEMPTHSDFAWACFVMKNMNLKWDQDWKYHKDNKETAAADKETFLKYKDLTKEDLKDDDDLCEDTWRKFCAIKPLFTSAKVKERFLESISIEGKAYYYKKYKVSMQIRSLVVGSDKKEYMDDATDRAEEKHQLTREIVKRKRKRDSEESSESEQAEEPQVGGSPTCVMVLDGEEGHADYVDDLIKKCTNIQGV